MAVTIEDLKARVETDLDDTILQKILDAAVAAVNRSAGNATSGVERYADARGAVELVLGRRATAITAVTERRSLSSDLVNLAADDYRLFGPYRVVRKGDGTNPASTWGKEVEVTFTPEIDAAVRDRVALDLAQVDLEFRAYERESEGDWEGDQKDYRARRRELLAQVREGRSLVA